MVALALALVAALSQDQAVGPELPPFPPVEEKAPAVAQESPAPPPTAEIAPKVSAPASEKLVPPSDPKPVSQKLVDRPESGPSLGGFVGGSLVVMALLVGLFVILKRFGRGSRFLAGGGVINVLARKPLGPRQEVFLVEVGPKVFLVGSTRDTLATLGEFSNPDEVAVLRSNLPGHKGDSMKLSFRDSLREGIRDEEDPQPAAARVYDSIAGELAEIRKTVRGWRA
jgi:flagellar biogenesis protein FliO